MTTSNEVLYIQVETGWNGEAYVLFKEIDKLLSTTREDNIKYPKLMELKQKLKLELEK